MNVEMLVRLIGLSVAAICLGANSGFADVAETSAEAF
jgi:hypothetical protein